MNLNKRVEKLKFYLTNYYLLFKQIAKATADYKEENEEHNLAFPDLNLSFSESRAISRGINKYPLNSFVYPRSSSTENLFYQLASKIKSESVCQKI